MSAQLAPRGVSSRRPWVRLLLETVVPVVLTLLWIAAWGLGRIQEFAPHASLWFPPAG